MGRVGDLLALVGAGLAVAGVAAWVNTRVTGRTRSARWFKPATFYLACAGLFVALLALVRLAAAAL